ncbi:MAG TPA: outer membrane beta-barrel protein [Burkholderiales bacterium]|nr:outer membrane beta-barrel protein [Burkholderiales bacterium]
MTIVRRNTVSMGLIACLLWATSAAAEGSPRAGKWDFFFEALYADSKTVHSQEGSSADIDSDFGWGLGVGYNFNDHWGLEFGANWFQSGYDAHIAPAAGNGNKGQSISGTLEVSNFGLNGIYYFLPRSFTPFVTAGIGGTYVDTNIPNGPAVPVCWWDPWWGYYCAPAYPTRSDTYFSYNAGAGVRWDSSRSLFLRALVSEQWVDVGGGAGTPNFLQVRFDIGTRF